MRSHFIHRLCLAALVLAVTLAGCTAAPTPIPTAIPTIDPLPTFNAIATQAVQTMAAELTQKAPTATPIIPTDTPAPTNTPEPTRPTETPAPTETPTRVFIPWTATPTATQAAYACTVTGSSTSPSTIKVGQDFDARWELKNSGTKTWVAGNTDLGFIAGSGTHFGTEGKLFDLQSDVAPNGTYTVVLDMVAPGGDGTYSGQWGIFLEDGSVCTLSLKINVAK